MDSGAWQATYSPWGHKILDRTEQLSIHACSQNLINLPKFNYGIVYLDIALDFTS